MEAWIILTLVTLTTAVPPNRVPVREILPPHTSNRHQQFVPSFQRDAVESPPSTTTTYDRLSDNVNYDDFGSRRYPLRDAVESLPVNVLYEESNSEFQDDYESDNGRVPLRDAVEHRVPPFLGAGVDHESIWIEPVTPPILRRTHEPKIICRYDSRAVHRTEPFSLFLQNIPNYKCTHLIYASALIDEKGIVIPSDPEYDRIKGGYNSATELRSKDPALRVLISIKFANPLSSLNIEQVARSSNFTLLRSILEFLDEYRFDGIELDSPTAGENWSAFKTLLKRIGISLAKKGYVFAVSLNPEDPVDSELPSIVDLITLKTWRELSTCRNCESTTKFALHPGPLSFVAHKTSEWIAQISAEQKSKIVLALPIFGQGYILKYANLTNAGAPVLGPGKEGVYTKRQDGKLAYFEVCEKLEDGLWVFGRDDEGPYTKRANQWIGYDDPISVKIKTAYVRAMGLGGVSLYSLDLDDFQGICGSPWPMLNTVARSLGYYEDAPTKKCPKDGLFRDPDNCSGFYSCIEGLQHHGHCGYKRFFDPIERRCVVATIEESSEICKLSIFDQLVGQGTSSATSSEPKKMLLRQEGPRVVCYVTSWALYRKGDGKFVPEHVDSQLCTDIVYAFAGLNPETLLIQTFDPWADIENNLYKRITSIKGSRIFLGLGGWTDSAGDKYSRLIGSDSARRRFVTTVINFLKEHNFDGLSLEWSYPKCWQSDCKKGPDSDKPNFTKLVQELRDEFNKQDPPLLLAVAMAGYKEVIDKAYEVREISQAVDFISVRSYDYHGAWESKAGHVAPLFYSPGDSNPFYNVNFTMNYLVKLGAEKSKLLLGIPLYGQSYRLSIATQAELGDPTTGPGKPGEFTKQPGMLAYYEICEKIKREGWKIGIGPSAHFEDQLVGYEDRESVYAKGKYIIGNGYGGATMWTIDLDDFQNRCCLESYPLLKTINRALGRLSTPISENCDRPPQPVTPQAPTLTTHSDAANGIPRPTSPMTTSTTKSTTWPTWTERPSTITTTTKQTTRTTWPSWTWTRPSKIPESSTKPGSTQKPSTSVTTAASTSRPSSTQPMTTQRPMTTPEKTDCMNGEYYSDPENCGNYYKCDRGVLRREQCAPGLHWDAKRHLCDWPSAAKCQAGTTTTASSGPSLSSTKKPSTITETTTTSTTTSTSRRTTTTKMTTRFTTSKPVVSTSTQLPQKPCEHGEYYPYPGSCVNFFVCVNGNLVSQQCGPGLNWNTEKNTCDYAFKNPCVEKQPNKSALLMEKDTVLPPCVSGSYSNVPGDCKSYQACLWGRQEVFKCAPGLHFNKETRICDWPSRAKCTDDESDEETTAQATTMWTMTTKTTLSQRPITEPTFTVETTPVTSITSQPASTLPSAIVDPDKVSSLSGYYKIVCYFTNWSWYRRGIGRYLPEHIDHTLCTHIVYGFAVLDYSDLIIKAHDSWADYDNRFYQRVVAYKKRGLKISLALGGWNDSAGDKYSRLVHSPTARKKFVDHVIQFLEKYGFDGLDLDWEYPVCWQVNCNKGKDTDKENFAALLRELSAEFKPRGLLLSAAVSPSKKVIDAGYDVPALSKYLDWIAVMCYDFHGQWDKKTGHVAPLYQLPSDWEPTFNANFSINYWIEKGANPKKLIMGVPLYGQSFSLAERNEHGLNAPTYGGGEAGEATRARGFLAYYEVF
ncbi:probable chitinase 3 isoform X2 [Pseudomyrmex gracilis]|uniref:probable chitinase 3 isoform X2 n=1 Tax=Pseudomyrmex gracilis TaxID=219809 RepID=UPI00099507C8|nr:probable chitinase 3 isoform X2 [Pseudomyrmex gracilis]